MAVLALAGCGESKDYVNDPRPPSPINISGTIMPDRISISPKQFGAGPVTIIIANLTEQTHKVTVETDDLTDGPGIKQTTSAINPSGTTTVKLNLTEGGYTVSVDGDGVRSARMKVGRQRPSSQDQLLQP